MSELDDVRGQGLEDIDRDELRKLAESDRDSSWVYQKVLEWTESEDEQ